MSVLTCPPINEEEIFRHCTKECGVITATEDQQYFTLGCLSCSGKFLYFDAFIEHIQTMHISSFDNGKNNCSKDNAASTSGHGILRDPLNHKRHKSCEDTTEDLTDADPTLLEPQVVMIKQEKIEVDIEDGDARVNNEAIFPNEELPDMFYNIKQEQVEAEEVALMDMTDTGFMADSLGSYTDEYTADVDEEEPSNNGDTNYDDLVEESLLENSNPMGVTNHIKDRKMIQFLINSYRRNSFLWDHHHPQFRDRVKRSRFIDWVNLEFKRRFNLVLAKDAVTRKWDNLRTVYKRECNRMALERTNVSTLWYFKELHFLNRLYGGTQKISDAVVKETVYRRRYSALWNDLSTNKLLSLLKTFPCFYDKYNIDYRSKDKRGEALQKMAIELQKFIEVTTIQISKRISQLRFDYSKQKQERLMCEMTGRVFSPTYSYYENMIFMDADIAPFKCDYCPMIINTPREMDTHLLTHQQATNATGMGGSKYYCPYCPLGYNDLEQFNLHKQIHAHSTASANNNKEAKYNCDLCTASFREKSNYDEHMRRHNDELLIPDLDTIPPDNSDEIITDDITPIVTNTNTTKGTPTSGRNTPIHTTSPTPNSYDHHMSSTEEEQNNFTCDYPGCGQSFTTRTTMMEHVKQHYNDEEFNCEVCSKSFKSIKNLHNHKQIHDAVKKYICKVCGSAFAQAAGLYLHKRRHNRQSDRGGINY